MLVLSGAYLQGRRLAADHGRSIDVDCAFLIEPSVRGYQPRLLRGVLERVLALSHNSQHNCFLAR